MDKLKLLTLFSGYDSQALAMERLKETYQGFDYDLVGWCEIDKFAIKAHNSIFPQWSNRNIGDITTIDYNDVPDCDIVTWSYPCTDISTAGHQMGLEKDSGTRSSLGWNAIELFRVKKPKYLVMENVKALVSNKFISSFKKMINELDKMGYVSFFKVLNSKNYGIPQNRERVFMVSILKEYLDEDFEFPSFIKLEKKVCDFIDKDVDENFNLLPKQIERCIKTLDIDNVDKKGDSIIKVCNYSPSGHNATNVISINGVSPTIMENHGSVYGIIYKTTKEKSNIKIDDEYYIVRKLTTREYFRLMDVDDKYIDKIQMLDIPKNQQYKLAGNSIVVSCLYYIFKEILGLKK